MLSERTCQQLYGRVLLDAGAHTTGESICLSAEDQEGLVAMGGLLARLLNRLGRAVARVARDCGRPGFCRRRSRAVRLEPVPVIGYRRPCLECCCTSAGGGEAR